MLVYQGTKAVWISALSGMTMVGSKRLPLESLKKIRLNINKLKFTLYSQQGEYDNIRKLFIFNLQI